MGFVLKIQLHRISLQLPGSSQKGRLESAFDKTEMQPTGGKRGKKP
jgi:hypothetical protein